MDTFQTFSGGSVTVSNSIRIYIQVAVAGQAKLDRSKCASRISVKAIAAKFTPRTCKRRLMSKGFSHTARSKFLSWHYLRNPVGTPGTRQYRHRRWPYKLHDLDRDRPCNRTEYPAERYHRNLLHSDRNWHPRCCARKCTFLQQKIYNRLQIFEKPPSTEVVPTCIGVANFGMRIAITWNAGGESATANWLVSGTGGASFTKLTHVTLRTGAHLDPSGRFSGGTATGRFHGDFA